MYFPFFTLHDWAKRSVVQPQTIYSEIPRVWMEEDAQGIIAFIFAP